VKNVPKPSQDTAVDREAFDAILRKLIAAPPTTKAAIIRKIKTKSRLRPLTRPVLQK
jgi:hypothetical protein